ncbi:MAG: sugar phosphate isomerase/epimerase family protein [Puniceicoccaceae bacterium]
MKLGFVSAILPDLPLDEVLGFAAKEQFECIELMCWPKGKAERRYAGVTHIDVANLTQGQADDINSVVTESGVVISALGYYPNILVPDEEESQVYIDHLKQVILAAEKLGLNGVNTFIGADPSKYIDDNFAKFEVVWPDIIKFAADHGIRIGIENCPMLFTRDEWPSGKNMAHTPAIWRRMFEAIPDKNFGLNYDPSHLVWQQIDYVEPLKEFADRIFHVHAKDCRVDKRNLDSVGILATPLEFHVPKLPGMGEVDWGRFFSVLTDTGYQGPVCIEAEDRAFEESLMSRKQCLKVAREILKPYFMK